MPSPLRRKRRSTAALQDAGALVTGARTSARFWSAPAAAALWISKEVQGPNACEKANGGPPRSLPALLPLLPRVLVWRDGRDGALRRPRPRSSGRNERPSDTSTRRSCAAARGADIAARCPYHAKHILSPHSSVAKPGSQMAHCFQPPVQVRSEVTVCGFELGMLHRGTRR